MTASNKFFKTWCLDHLAGGRSAIWIRTPVCAVFDHANSSLCPHPVYRGAVGVWEEDFRGWGRNFFARMMLKAIIYSCSNRTQTFFEEASMILADCLIKAQKTSEWQDLIAWSKVSFSEHAYPIETDLIRNSHNCQVHITFLKLSFFLICAT